MEDNNLLRRESEERFSNVVWTISEKYSIDPDFTLVKFTGDRKIDLYNNTVLGGIYRFFDYEMIYSYINKIKVEISDPKPFFQIAVLVLEENVISNIEISRPAIKKLKEDVYKKILSSFFFNKPKDSADEIRFAYYSRKIGKSPAVNSKVYKLVKEIDKGKSISSTIELIEFLSKIFQDYFHFESYFDNENVVPEEKEALSDNTDTSTKDSPNSYLYDELQEEYVSAEYNPNASKIDPKDGYEFEDNKMNFNINPEVYNKLTDKIEQYYGASIVSFDELRKLEKKICTGMHKGCHIHITDGNFKLSHINNYRVKYVKKQKEKNMIDYNDHYRVYNRNISKLKDIIQRTILRDTEYSKNISDNGMLRGDIIWKIKYLNNSKVFEKEVKEDIGDFAVDILLDSSGSQMERQSRVASQGYVISQALSLVNIPNRVLSFNNFLDFTIIRRFRDYNDPIIKNKNIFEYYATGSNRDGLAIRAVVESLEKRPEEHKILIVLSDGKPNDVKVTKTSSVAFNRDADYKGIKAVKDTAHEVRKARMKGIAVLGVYTGEIEDLDAEKLIYGKDFAYIHSIDRFSEIVGLYLKRQINNMIN